MSATVTPFAAIPTAPASWLWPAYIPKNALTILSGPVGVGKSTILAALIAALSNGHPWPNHAPAAPTNTLILTAPDNPPDRVAHRLRLHGANLDRVFTLAAADPDPDSDSQTAQSAANALTLTDLTAAIARHHIGLVVLDPVSALLPLADFCSEASVRAALHPLLTAIAHADVAVIATITTTNSRPSNRRAAPAPDGARYRPWTGLAASVLHLAHTPLPDLTAQESVSAAISAYRTLTVIKANHAAIPPAIHCRIAANGTVVWAEIDADDPDLTPTEAMNRQDARVFLNEFLAESPARATEILTQAAALGFSERTIRRAKADLAIVSYRTKPYGHWTWALPDQHRPPQTVQPDADNEEPGPIDEHRLNAAIARVKAATSAASSS